MIYDSYKDKKNFISGSSLPEIAIHSLSYLVGRVNIIQVFPVDFKEFIEYKNKSKSNILEEKRSFNQLNLLKTEFEEYLQFGGYLAIIVLKTMEEKKQELNNIVNTYLLKEIREILNFENVFDFEKTLRRIALADGGIINKSNISAELEINRVTFNKIIDILNKTAIIYFLEPFLNIDNFEKPRNCDKAFSNSQKMTSKTFNFKDSPRSSHIIGGFSKSSNKIKEIVKSPKIYFADLGFKNMLIKNFNKLELRQDKGSIYESFILSAILNYDLRPQFWNYKNEFEIDFVLEGNENIFGFEVKSSLKDDNITTSMKKFIDLYNPKEIIIFNEKIESQRIMNNTKITFTSHLNIFNILKRIKGII